MPHHIGTRAGRRGTPRAKPFLSSACSDAPRNRALSSPSRVTRASPGEVNLSTATQGSPDRENDRLWCRFFTRVFAPSAAARISTSRGRLSKDWPTQCLQPLASSNVFRALPPTLHNLKIHFVLPCWRYLPSLATGQCPRAQFPRLGTRQSPAAGSCPPPGTADRRRTPRLAASRGPELFPPPFSSTKYGI